tara:strand:- start:145 stop:432 length:288 start_codon:yes stop_codon:yes gene_type:complete
MALFKNVNGTRIPLSSQEEASFLAEEAAWVAAEDDRKAEGVRAERNAMLSSSDWMAVSDRTIAGPETAYRQSLRDVPQQTGFPNDVVWPVKPQEV